VAISARIKELLEAQIKAILEGKNSTGIGRGLYEKK